MLIGAFWNDPARRREFRPTVPRRPDHRHLGPHHPIVPISSVFTVRLPTRGAQFFSIDAIVAPMFIVPSVILPI
jgi:hypothetical protein